MNMLGNSCSLCGSPGEGGGSRGAGTEAAAQLGAALMEPQPIWARGHVGAYPQ